MATLLALRSRHLPLVPILLHISSGPTISRHVVLQGIKLPCARPLSLSISLCLSVTVRLSAYCPRRASSSLVALMYTTQTNGAEGATINPATLNPGMFQPSSFAPPCPRVFVQDAQECPSSSCRHHHIVMEQKQAQACWLLRLEMPSALRNLVEIKVPLPRLSSAMASSVPSSLVVTANSKLSHLHVIFLGVNALENCSFFCSALSARQQPQRNSHSCTHPLHLV